MESRAVGQPISRTLDMGAHSASFPPTVADGTRVVRLEYGALKAGRRFVLAR